MDPKVLAAIVGMLLCLSSSVSSAMSTGGDSPSSDGNGNGDSPSSDGDGNGDSPSSSSDEQEKVENALDFEVGTPIQCTANDVGSGVNAAIYRYMGGTELRWYPNPPIASSWDSDWGTTFKKIDCKGLTKGDDMAMKP